MAKKHVVPAPPTTDVTLVDFLVGLSIDANLRAQFSANPAATLDGVQPPLSQIAKTAVLAQNRAAVMAVLDVNQQSTGPVPPPPPAAPAVAKRAGTKKAAKKTSKRARR
jgi:hypothetical protein